MTGNWSGTRAGALRRTRPASHALRNTWRATSWVQAGCCQYFLLHYFSSFFLALLWIDIFNSNSTVMMRKVREERKRNKERSRNDSFLTGERRVDDVPVLGGSPSWATRTGDEFAREENERNREGNARAGGIDDIGMNPMHPARWEEPTAFPSFYLSRPMADGKQWT